MKILWIEDFGGSAQRFELAEGIFEKIVKKFEWDRDEDISTQLYDISKTESTHKITTIQNYPEFKEIQNKSMDYDIIIIDFNLSEGEFDHSIKPEKYQSDEKFHERAGFYIFSYLITHNFPLENIVFMTGEIDSTLQSFLVETIKMYLPYEPNHFGKNKEGYDGISKYLFDKANNNYITLRRGIIEGCKYLKEQLSEQSPDWILFNKTTEANLDKDYLKDYLTKLEDFLPLHPPENIKSLLYRFLKELSAEWEMSQGAFREYLKMSREKYNFKKMCQNQMKLLRNWTSHSQLTDDITEKEVAFFFMLAMRAWFNLDYSEIQDYEKVLSEIFDKNEITNIRNQLAKSYQSLREELDNFNPKRNEFSDLIRSIAKKFEKSDDKEQLQKLSKKLFYQNFWHGLFPASLIVARQREDKDSVAMFVNFESQNFPGNSFPYFLGRLIYNEFAE